MTVDTKAYSNKENIYKALQKAIAGDSDASVGLMDDDFAPSLQTRFEDSVDTSEYFEEDE